MSGKVFKAALACAAVALGAGCYTVESPESAKLTSFLVKVDGIYLPRAPGGDGLVHWGDPGMPLQVVSACRKEYGSDLEVPREVRGTPSCRYVIPRANVEIDVSVIALGKDGKPLDTFSGPVSLRVVPGDLTGNNDYRWLQVVNGVGTGTIKVAHLYSEVRVWAEDAPPQPIYDGGTADLSNLPGEPEHRTMATGTSPIVFFEEPSVAKLQIPDGFDNRSSPFVGQFITVGRAPEGGATLKQSCEADEENDGKEAILVVTGTDPSGFFVTDVTACRQPEVLVDEEGATQVRVPEPDGYLPGTFGSMFIYNYSFPEGLDTGDALWSIAGSVQEFTSTTQLTFPSWVTAERVRLLPQSQWGKWLSRVPIKEVSLRLCGLDDKADPFVTDVLCGHNRRNLKLESLESGLVKITNARLAQTFKNCDVNGDGQVPFFCEQRGGDGAWFWGECGNFDGAGSTLSPDEQQEVACNVNCVTGQGEFAGTLCTEAATYNGFGQYIAELAGPGPAAAGLDETLPARIEQVNVGATSKLVFRTFGAGNEVRVFCDAPVHVRFGDDSVVATAGDPLVPANTLLEHTFVGAESKLALIGGSPQPATCKVSMNSKTRINVVTKDAIPELVPNCDPADADPEKAQQCRNLRGARFDIVGHLRHLQPGRPRWVILPRDKDDLCCHPGPGLECPAPIKPCP